MEITKERADELTAAWEAATDTQRLSMNRISWFGSDTIKYFEEKPSKLELKAAARIAELEGALLKWRNEAKDGDMTLMVPRWELVALIGEKPAN